ncbi:saccharopine dehydrogenase NADP-binding domain-containing protein [Colwellia sp. 12G3]|uniref:saccharopine dehydrogenase NADP-binding domain-containing protein n=1 Tax=Colwellia sp. 12G3 TaxID=2058299 RepID=UPI000C33DA47|nr:saccharopine dehydrogenase NADP-binding domain-containing protein [Colwellia sp. 12G3]PKI17403.1 hypothetical protein CXF71_04070 [Colwellia sp. 12G3]
MNIYLLGATGFTGHLLLPQLIKRDLKITAIGRNKSKLNALQVEFPMIDIAEVDATDEAALKALIKSGDLLISTVGPFMELGQIPLKVAVDNGAHYMDSTGEPTFINHIYETYENQLKDSEQLIMPACGYDYIPGLFLAEKIIEETKRKDKTSQVDTVNIAYSTLKGKIVSLSSGTLTSLIKALYEEGTFYKNGRWYSDYLCNTSWKINVNNKTVRCVSLAGLEGFEIPKNHKEVLNVNTYLGWFGPLTIVALGFSKLQKVLFKIPGYLALMRKLVKHVSIPRRKSENIMKSKNSDVYLYAEARDKNNVLLSSATLEGHNMYQYTVDIMAWIADRITKGDYQQHGVIGPARAFGLEDFTKGHQEVGMKLTLNSDRKQ